MGGPGGTGRLNRADSLAFLSRGSPGGGTLPAVPPAVEPYLRFPRRWNLTFGSLGGGTLPAYLNFHAVHKALTPSFQLIFFPSLFFRG